MPRPSDSPPPPLPPLRHSHRGGSRRKTGAGHGWLWHAEHCMGGGYGQAYCRSSVRCSPRGTVRLLETLETKEGDDREMAVEKTIGSSSLVEVVDRVLDKGIVVDAWVRLSLVGIEILALEARVVVASVETYLKYAEAVRP